MGITRSRGTNMWSECKAQPQDVLFYPKWCGPHEAEKRRAFEGLLAALEKDLHKIPSAQTSSALRAGLGGRERIGWDFAAINFHGMIGKTYRYISK